MERKEEWDEARGGVDVGRMKGEVGGIKGASCVHKDNVAETNRRVRTAH